MIVSNLIADKEQSTEAVAVHTAVLGFHSMSFGDD
jgi:hypothetical protein